jgi:hypothetical protein
MRCDGPTQTPVFLFPPTYIQGVHTVHVPHAGKFTQVRTWNTTEFRQTFPYGIPWNFAEFNATFRRKYGRIGFRRNFRTNGIPWTP